jgi:hypothetical protein
VTAVLSAKQQCVSSTPYQAVTASGDRLVALVVWKVSTLHL